PWAEPAAPDLPATVDVSADVPACGSRYALDEVRYVDGQSLPDWYLDLDAFHLASPTPGVGPWSVSMRSGPIDDTPVYGYSDPVGVLVRRSDGLVVARTDSSALAQREFWTSPSLWFPVSPGPFPASRAPALVGPTISWAPVGCSDLGGGIQAGGAFDPGGWGDDHGFTLHVGQRVTLWDGTVGWYWASRNPDDPLYAP
ncbi:MAG TPA: hypothetical protein PKB06_07170, partial [Actinotalea sp.]|nr:hypothetical protein [Actinotalea sp.]